MKIKGIVESITQQYIEGWVIVFDDENNIIKEPKVELKVNGQIIAETFAVRETSHLNSDNNNCGFRFLVKDLFNYINANDEITISTYNENIPFYSYGLSYKAESSGNFTSNVLISKLREGFAFDANGEFNVSLKKNEKFRKESITLYKELNNYFTKYLSSELFACYGTLLGIVRDNDFISNDGNFDCAYFSKKYKKKDVIDEFKNISKNLIKEGYTLKIERSHIQVSRNEFTPSINIYCVWLNEENKFMMSFDYLGNEIVKQDKTFEIQSIVISDERINIPKDYEIILQQIYGERWKLADFGFTWSNMADKLNFLSHSDINEIYWEQYYLNSKKQNPSTFCTLVNDFIKNKYFVLDIGCGSARDSLEFANKGHEVVGIDRSQEAIMFASSLSNEVGYKNINFEVIDISCENTFSKRLKIFKDKAHVKNINTLYYSRFFLHSIDENTEDKLLEILSHYIDKGDIFAAEFRCMEDQDRHKTYGNHYRRFIDEKKLLSKLEKKCGMTKLILFQKGTGFSLYKDENPFLARIMVEKI